MLAGILAGLALGEKYTASFVPLALGAIVLFQGGRRLPNAQAWRNAILLCGSALRWHCRGMCATIFLWAIPSIRLPLAGCIGTRGARRGIRVFGTGLLNEPLQLLARRGLATVTGFQGGEFDATIGALLLALLPFNLLKRTEATKNAPTRLMWFLVTVLFAFWLLGVAQSKLLWQTRLLFPAFSVAGNFGGGRMESPVTDSNGEFFSAALCRRS